MKKNILFITIASLFSINSIAEENINIEVETNVEFSVQVNGQEVQPYQGAMVEDPEAMMAISEYAAFYYLQEIHCKENRHLPEDAYQRSKEKMKAAYLKQTPEQKEAINQMFKESLSGLQNQYMVENKGNNKDSCAATYKEVEAMANMMFGG